MTTRRNMLKGGLFAGCSGLVPGAGLCAVPDRSDAPESPYVGVVVDHERLRGVEDVHLVGDLAYLPCREGQRLTVVSVQDPTRPVILGTFTHPELDQVAGFALDGTTAFLGSHHNHTLMTVDVSDPANMKFLGKVQLGPEDGPKGIYKVAYRDGYCYVALNQSKSLYVGDVRDRRNPAVAGNVQVTTEDDGAFGVYLRGRHALVGTVFGRNNRLAVVDISDPGKPRLISSLVHPVISQAMGQFAGNRFVTASWERHAVVVYDVSDPASPLIEGVLVDERLGNPNRLAISGDFACMPDSVGHGIALADISDPGKPRFAAKFVDPVILKKAYGIAARGDLVFVGAREGNSLSVLDRHKLLRVARAGNAAIQ